MEWFYVKYVVKYTRANLQGCYCLSLDDNLVQKCLIAWNKLKIYIFVPMT